MYPIQIHRLFIHSANEIKVRPSRLWKCLCINISETNGGLVHHSHGAGLTFCSSFQPLGIMETRTQFLKPLGTIFSWWFLILTNLIFNIVVIKFKGPLNGRPMMPGGAVEFPRGISFGCVWRAVSTTMRQNCSSKLCVYFSPGKNNIIYQTCPRG